MYNPQQKQYILKNSFGVSYHVYYEQWRGLCIRMLSDSRIWSRGYVLDNTAINDFSVVLDKDDIFHFIFQSKDGSIFYGHGRHGQIEVQPILNSKDPTPWPKHVFLLVCDNTILFFYTIKYQDRCLVSMQTIKNGALSKPVAIDYLDEPDIQYRCFIDNSGKCHLIYTNTDKDQMQILHRVLKEDFGVFNSPEKIYKTDSDIRFLSAVYSETNDIHVTFEVSTDESYEIMYKNLSKDNTVESLYKGTVSPGYTGLVYNNGVIIFYRVANENILFSVSENQGKNWTDEELYPLSGSSAACFSYITNYKKESDFFSFELPGNFSRGYQLAFFNEDKIKALHEKRIKENQNKKDYGELKKKVILLQNLTDNMQRELTKLWLTQKSFEKKLEHLNRSYSSLWDSIQYQNENEYIEKTPNEPSDDTPDISETGDIENA